MKQSNDPSQEVISSYFEVKILSQVVECMDGNQELEEILMSSGIAELVTDKNNACQTSVFLKALMKASSKNLCKAPKGRRYDYQIKKFACVLYLVSGKMGYEILYANLQSSLPSISTIKQLLDKETENFRTGTIRVLELKGWLLKRGFELRVCVAEDQTKILESVQYNPRFNCLDGFSLPLGSNGFPISNPFSAKNASSIKTSIETGEIAPYINVFMVQPLSISKSPGFCLNVYPTNSRFCFKDCLNRWEFLEDLFRIEGKQLRLKSKKKFF